MKRMTGNKQREILLLYRFRGTEVGQNLHRAAARMGVLCKVIEEDQIDIPLGGLLKLSGFTMESRPARSAKEMAEITGADESDEAFETICQPEEQAMIMYGFSQSRLDFLLSASRRAGNPIIPLKAIVTPTNVDWTFRELYCELVKEHRYMTESKKQQAE